MTHEGMDPALEEAFEQLRQVPAPDASRQADQRAALLEGAHRYRAATASPGPRRWALVGVLVAIVLALVVGTGGIVYAADVAVPGDILYGMDRAIESARLSLTSQPQAAAELLLSFTGERLVEAEALSAKEAQESDVEDQDGDGSDPCLGTDSHPVGKSLAEAYGLDEGTVMDWFCNDGYGFGEIMHALETSEATGLTPDEVLDMRIDMGWGQIWQELGLKGKPDNVPPGPPDHAGPPGDDGDDDDQDDPYDDDQDDPNDDDDQDDPDNDDDSDPCDGGDSHPVGQHLADTYKVGYDEIMGWFCDGGFGFGEIKHALEASEATGEDPQEVLDRRSDQGWGQIWQELGLKGKPDDEDKAKDDKSNGPPDDKDKKDKEKKPDETSDDKVKKDKDDKPNGATDEKDKKDKEEKPVGPPDDKAEKDKKDKKDKSGN